MLKRKKPAPLEDLRCPFCKNDKLVIYLDFKKKNKAINMAICVKTAFKSRLFGKPMIRGCGKRFRVNLKEK